MFDEYHGQILNAIDEQMKDLIMAPTVAAIEICNEVFADSVLESTRNSNVQQQHRLYTYSIVRCGMSQETLCSLETRNYSQDDNFG